MNIGVQNNSTFSSRNPNIRFADNLVRKVNTEYPRISGTKVECFNNSEKFENVLGTICDKLEVIRCNIEKYHCKKTSKKNKIKKILFLIKNLKVGNCNESSLLSLVAAKINGIENCSLAYLVSPKGFDYDHSIVLVNDKKPYIIDAWLGFVDYVPNAIKKYQKELFFNFDFKRFKCLAFPLF